MADYIYLNINCILPPMEPFTFLIDITYFFVIPYHFFLIPADWFHYQEKAKRRRAKMVRSFREHVCSKKKRRRKRGGGIRSDDKEERGWLERGG